MPKSLRDPVLGTLRWEERRQWWIGETELTPGCPIEFFISPGDDDPNTVLGRVRSGLERIREHEAAYRRWTAEHAADDRWNSDEEMTVEEITDLLKLASIDFSSDAGADLYWDDGDRLFWGHNFITAVDAGGKCTEVRIEG